ncbi:MAG: tetratricopeptide repeat protein, partial [Desulfobaccales bacterium]
MSEDKKTIVKMAHIYSQEGRWDKAIAEYKKLIKLDPEDFNSYSMLGDVFVKKGELQPAFDAYLVCSDAYIRLGQLEKAALVQSKIARLSPEALSADSRKKQGVFQKQVEGDKAMDAGDMDAAIASYQVVLQMDPDRFDLYQKLGDLYLRKGETESACRKYLEIGDIYFKNKLIKKAA